MELKFNAYLESFCSTLKLNALCGKIFQLKKNEKSVICIAQVIAESPVLSQPCHSFCVALALHSHLGKTTCKYEEKLQYVLSALNIFGFVLQK